MKTKKVECDECQNFIEPKLTVNGMIKSNAKCELGKRVMFRFGIYDGFGCGYPRYCNEFKANDL